MSTFLPVVLSGNVKLVRFPEAGKEVIIGTFTEGDIFAIPPALDGKRFPATAIATEESQILLLPRNEFLGLMASSTEFSSLVLTQMCSLLRERTQTVQILATTSAERRVAGVLLRLVDEMTPGETRVIHHRRQDIAEMAGLTIETTIRVIRRLSKRGSLRISHGKIHIDTPEHLQKFLD